MNQKSHNNRQHTKEITTSLKLSLMPSIFAAGCCATAPLMFIFGISSADFLLPNYGWLFKIGGGIILLLSIGYYFYTHGIHTLDEAKATHKHIFFVSVYTIILSVLIYYFFTLLAVPTIWTSMLNGAGNCCGI